ncbi:hypothetical protein K435DRAFT_776282 [Dendrothele bispora CBS 962.96]|uniref:Uncharacterized protein n=1 Tax=Dendrothele bispora (strain CBS 962.96) TaxID=1314807 RepID=A0A4S8MEK3_DENBC|nr:hypothetical protein K435DRAFT_776282 [Dendrothele bispora CBS 962.96]
MLSIIASIAILIAVKQILNRHSEHKPSCSHPTAEELLVRCQELEHQLVVRDSQYEDLRVSAAASHVKYLQLEKHYISNEERYHRQCVELQQRNTALVTHFDTRRKEMRLLPLTLFAERLLLANKMWQQKRVANETRNRLVLKKKQLDQSVFDSFRDQLVLSNEIWRQQKELKEVKEEAEKIKRGRIRAITRQAKRMVIDTRREGMIGELVKDLTKEVQEEKQKVLKLQEQHAEEVRSITAEWETKYRELLREIECLRLAQKARLIEQEISNDLEDRLCSRVRELEAGVRH